MHSQLPVKPDPVGVVLWHLRFITYEGELISSRNAFSHSPSVSSATTSFFPSWPLYTGLLSVSGMYSVLSNSGPLYMLFFLPWFSAHPHFPCFSCHMASIFSSSLRTNLTSSETSFPNNLAKVVLPAPLQPRRLFHSCYLQQSRVTLVLSVVNQFEGFCLFVFFFFTF